MQFVQRTLLLQKVNTVCYCFGFEQAPSSEHFIITRRHKANTKWELTEQILRGKEHGDAAEETEELDADQTNRYR